MQKLMLSLLFFLFANQAFANPASSAVLIQSLSSLLKVQTPADLAKLKNDVQSAERLECFEGNQFITNPMIIDAVVTEEVFNTQIFNVKPPGIFESLFWGNHASNKYTPRISDSAFFNFPPSVWSSLRNGNIQMFIGIDPNLKKQKSADELKAQFVQEAEKLKSMFSYVTFRCVQDNIHIAWAKQLLSLIESSDNCPNALK